MEKFELEKQLDGHPKSVSVEALKKVIEILEKCICKIKISNGCGTGFFSNIYLDDWESLRVLITNNHVLNQDDIKPGNKIKFSLNNEKEFFEIEIDEDRKTYTSLKYDVTIIEIKQKDNLKKDSFLEIDNDIYKDINLFRNKSIYFLHYPNGKEMKYAQGVIKCIYEDNYTKNIYAIVLQVHQEAL